MSSLSRVRTTSPQVDKSAGCAPLKAAYHDAVRRQPKTWGEVEELLLRAMERFDANVAAGIADMGDLQNGKGDFFNDLLALLLENCAGVQLDSRGKVPGLMIPRHNLDVPFPAKGSIEFILEAKAVGTPRHPGSPKQKAIGRQRREHAEARGGGSVASSDGVAPSGGRPCSPRFELTMA